MDSPEVCLQEKDKLTANKNVFKTIFLYYKQGHWAEGQNTVVISLLRFGAILDFFHLDRNFHV